MLRGLHYAPGYASIVGVGQALHDSLTGLTPLSDLDETGPFTHLMPPPALAGALPPPLPHVPPCTLT